MPYHPPARFPEVALPCINPPGRASKAGLNARPKPRIISRDRIGWHLNFYKAPTAYALPQFIKKRSNGHILANFSPLLAQFRLERHDFHFFPLESRLFFKLKIFLQKKFLTGLPKENRPDVGAAER